MKKIFTLFVCAGLFVFLNVQHLSAQNLVPNYGFEAQDTCPAVSQITLAQPWNSPTLGTPDLFNSTCGSQNSPARTGIGSSGVYCYSTFANNREYLQAPLTSSLTGGQTYCVSFYVSRSNFRYAMNRIGAYFSTGAVNQSTTSVLNFIPDVENPSANMLSANGWLQISGSFVASGGETHILIGNFANDANTDTLVVNSTSSSKVAYYKIDDVSVTTCVAGVDEKEFIASSILLSPIPASDMLTIRADNGVKISGYEIINISGSVIKADLPFFSGPGVFQVDVSSLSNGIYFISFDTVAGKINKKIIITR